MTIDSPPLAPRQARGPVRRAERALAPDLARGAMLLFIALANALGVVFGGSPSVDAAPTGAEGGFSLLVFTFVHTRAYPVFAVMFGYGLVQLARRQESSGATPAAVRGVLLRRNAWLVVFGLAHAVLLYFGDFLGAYGLVGIIATVLLLQRSERVQRVVLWIWGASLVYAVVVAVLALVSVLSSTGTSGKVEVVPTESLRANDYGSSLLDRLAEWPVHTLTVLPFVMIVWLGMWAARRRVLEEPGAHRPLLRRVAVVGLGVAVAGGLPLGLVSAGVLHVDPSAVSMLVFLQEVTGMFAGPGYVAVFGLIALRLSRRSATPRDNPVTGAVAALGQRSLSGYLFQSVAWLVLLLPFTLHLGARFGSPTFTAAAVATLVWVVSLVGARALDRRGRRGPAETVLRALTYPARKG